MSPKGHYRNVNAYRVREIRRAYAAGEKQDVLSAMYGISQAAISRIVNGRTWRHVVVDSRQTIR